MMMDSASANFNFNEFKCSSWCCFIRIISEAWFCLTVTNNSTGTNSLGMGVVEDVVEDDFFFFFPFFLLATVVVVADASVGAGLVCCNDCVGCSCGTFGCGAVGCGGVVVGTGVACATTRLS